MKFPNIFGHSVDSNGLHSDGLLSEADMDLEYDDSPDPEEAITTDNKSSETLPADPNAEPESDPKI